LKKFINAIKLKYPEYKPLEIIDIGTGNIDSKLDSDQIDNEL